VPKFKKGDICICSYSLRRNNKKGGSIIKNDCRVKITSIQIEENPDLEEDGQNIIYNLHIRSGRDIYNVYNLDFERYEKIGEFYLKLDLEETRNHKLKNLLNE